MPFFGDGLLTYTLSSANLPKLSRNSLLPPWWKCRAGRGGEDSFSLKMRNVQPSSFTVMELRSPTLKLNAPLLLSLLWFREPDRQHTGNMKHTHSNISITFKVRALKQPVSCY